MARDANGVRHRAAKTSVVVAPKVAPKAPVDWAQRRRSIQVHNAFHRSRGYCACRGVCGTRDVAQHGRMHVRLRHPCRRLTARVWDQAPDVVVRGAQGMIMLAVAFAALYLIIEKKLNRRDDAPGYGENGEGGEAVYEEAEDYERRADRNHAPLCCEAVLEDAALKEVSQRCVDSHQPPDADVVMLTYLPRSSLDTYGKYALSIMGAYALTHGHRLERWTGLVPRDKRHPEYHRVLIVWKVRRRCQDERYT
jgi:hypothetical protein